MPIWFHGECSRDLGILVEHRPVRPIAKRKYDRVPIPGASRDLILQEDAWENVQQPYDIAIRPLLRDPFLHRTIRRVVQWLNTDGYQRLEDSYDPDLFRLGTCMDGGTVENLLGRFGRCTVTFDCDGRWFLKSGEAAVAPENADKALTLINPTGYNARPVLSIRTTGTGRAVLLVRNADGTQSAVRLNASGMGVTVTVDCETQKAVYGNGRSANSAVSFLGPAPRLRAGESVVDASGDEVLAFEKGTFTNKGLDDQSATDLFLRSIGHVAVTAGESYTVTPTKSAVVYVYFYAANTAASEFLSRVSGSGECLTFTVPAGAAYIRVLVNTGAAIMPEDIPFARLHCNGSGTAGGAATTILGWNITPRWFTV